MRRLSGTIVLAAVCVVSHVGAAERSPVPEEAVAEIKRTVVNVERHVAHALNGESARRGRATGFVVDADRGIVATNRHVAGTSPAQLFITFENGEQVSARVLHYDAYHDFAFLRYEPVDLGFQPRVARMVSSFSLAEQTPVAMVGNNDVAEYSVKFGRVTNLSLNEGGRHSATFQTSFDRAGGSSGSPVIDATGAVVGVHFAGSSTTSYELRIDYLIDAIRQLRTSGSVKRGDLGVSFDLIHLADAKSHFGLPEAEAGSIRALRAGSKNAILVNRLVPSSPAEGLLMPGDIVVGIDDRLLGDDLYLLDRLVDEHVGDTVNLTVFRNGTPLALELPVPDAEAQKIRSFALFAGGVLQDLSQIVRLRYGVRGSGTWLSQASPGSPLAELGTGRNSQPESRAVQIMQVNGVATPTLEDFIAAVTPLETGDDINVMLLDYRSRRTPTVDWLTLDLKYAPLRVFDFDAERLDWTERPPSPDPG